MIVVAGATGILGGEIARRILGRGEAVRALVRPTSDRGTVERLRAGGAEIVEADLKEPASLERACAGAEVVVSGVTAVFPREPGDSIESVDREGQMRLVDAAAKAGARRFVYISFSGTVETRSPLTEAKRSVERHLEQSGIEYTVLRPTSFMEAWLGPPLGFDLAAARVRVFGSGKQRHSFISVGDVAEFAAQCVRTRAARNRIIELGGPEGVAPLDVVRRAEAISGRAIAVEHVPVDAIEQQLAAATDASEASLADLMLYATGDDVVDMSDVLRDFDVRLTTVDDYVRRVLGPPG